MIIKNKVLEIIEDEDVDENGVCVIPEGIDEIKYIENDRIRKLVIPEGVRIIGTDGIYCPNLEQIELPSSLERIKIIDSERLTLENIKFGNKTFTMDYNWSLGGFKITAQYTHTIAQDLTSRIEEAINTKDYSSIVSIMKLYDSNCWRMNQEDQDKLSYLIGKLLSQKVDGIEIGEKMLVECFKKDEQLTPFLFQYYHFIECEKLGLKWIPLTIEEVHGNLADSDEKRITLGYRSLTSKKGIMLRGQNLADLPMNDNALINLNAMFVLSHELQHSRQRANGERTEDVSGLLDYIDFKTTKAAPYNNDHDIHPDEIRADLGAYDSLIEHTKRLLPASLGEKYKKIIERIKLGRIEQAHQIDENGNIGVLDYRQRFFKKSLADPGRSDNSRSQLLTLQKKYIELLSIANSKGIDLYEGSLGYYRSKKNVKGIQKDEKE